MSQGCRVDAKPPPLPGGPGALVERPISTLWHRFEQRMGLDLRSLALFRVVLAALIVWDLLTRAPWIDVFYTQAGVLPVDEMIQMAAHSATRHYISLHAANGSYAFQVALFGLAGLVASALLIGWRTRTMTILSWVLLVSLQCRHGLVLNAGDSLLRMLLFWGMFLPLGARWSVDSALNTDATSDPGKRNNRLWSIPALCFLVQLCLVYWCTAGLKSHDYWLSDHSAVFRALQLEYMIRPLGSWLATFPSWFLACMTVITVALEFTVPLLLWIPVWVGPLRTIAVFIMLGMHLSFALTLDIGLFSQIASAAWLAILPTWFWDKLFARFRRNPKYAGAVIWYDGDCGFCQKMALLVRTFLLLPETPLRAAHEDRDIQKILTKQNTWVFEDASGNRSTHFDGVVAAVRASPWAFVLAPIVGWGPIRALGNHGYRWIANHRGFMGRMVAWARYAPRALAPTRYRWVRDTVLLALLFIVILINVSVFHTKKSFPPDSARGSVSKWAYDALKVNDRDAKPGFTYTLRIVQAWNMFAPRPPTHRGWFHVVGELRDDTEVELWDAIVLEQEPKTPDNKRPALLVDDYPTPRWRKYMSYMHKKGRRRHRPLFCKWLARSWAEKYPDRPLRRVRIYYHKESIAGDGSAKEKPRESIWTYTVP